MLLHKCKQPSWRSLLNKPKVLERRLDDNSLFDGWEFADGLSDPISVNPDLRNDNGLGGSSIL